MADRVRVDLKSEGEEDSEVMVDEEVVLDMGYWEAFDNFLQQNDFMEN